MLAGGVNLYENGRVDQSIWESTPAFLGRWGNISFCTAGIGSVEELPMAGFYSFRRGGLVQPEELAGVDEGVL